MDDIHSSKEVVRSSILELCKNHYSTNEMSSLLEQYPDKDIYKAWLDKRVLLVAEDDNQIVGFAQYHPANKSIEAVHVLPDHTNQGIGKNLIKKIEEIAKEQGARKISLGSSLNAEKFYEKCGYLRKEPGKYQCSNGVELDIVVYEKEVCA